MENKELFELTNPQKSIWYTEQFYSGSNINNITGYLKITNNADLKALEKAFNIFVSKNDSFRIKICVENNLPKQYFCDLEYQYLDILKLDNESDLESFENNFPLKTISVLNNFLFIAKLLSFPDGTGILVLTTHHLISDAWTMTLCLEEIYDNYQKIINNEEISQDKNPSYLDFINSQKKYMQSDKFNTDKLYWKEKFNSLPGILSFKNGAKTDITANRKVCDLDMDLYNNIVDFCKKYGISDYVFLLAIFSIYFRGISNLNTFVLGNPIFNRANFKEKHMTGMFVSIMPFIVDLTQSLSFSDFCTKLALEQKQMYRHIRFPYHEILNYIRDKHDFSDTLYDVVFSYQNESIPSYCKWLPNHSQAESLQIHIKNISNETCEMAIHYDYLTDVFSENDIELMHKGIINLINQVISNPYIMVDDLEIISTEEKFTLLNTFNDTKSSYHKDSTIVKEFEKIADLYPNNIAVIDSYTSLTYKELNNKANFLAKKILDSNVKSDIIAFSFKRSADIIIAILAILKSGHTYMPIDPDYPVDRINFMLDNSNTKILISTPSFLENICFNGTFINFDDLKFDEIIDNLNIEIPSNKKAYIMYTSGSTGIPKAVTIMHYNVLNFVNSMQKRLNYRVTPQNKVLSVTTVCFDIFVFEVFPTLLSGLTLVIANELEAKSPKLLSEIIQKYEVSKILTTPSRIELLFEDNSYLEAISSVKEFILGGEPLQTNLLLRLKEYTNAKIFDLYGPTETTVYSTFKDLTNDNIISIGKPIDNTQIYILNDNNRLQPIGVTGEICIGGDGVGAGYYNNKEKTNAVFVENPYVPNDIIYKTGDLGYWNSNGELTCLGRKDNQIKIRGYRIELDDISSNILAFDGIDKCVVIDKVDNNKKKCLCAYYTSSQNINVSDLKKYLLNILPNYMIPNYFVKLDAIPLTINHKVNRKALPDPDFNKSVSLADYVKPSTETEKLLCDLFVKDLNISKIGIKDDIFDYSIDSLDIIKIQTQLLDYNIKLNTQDFYKYRTIEDLSNLIDNKSEFSNDNIDVDYLKTVNKSFFKHTYLPSSMVENTYKNILLIGCTGYLGIHLLHELINTSNSHITCIIREKYNQSSVERFNDLYQFYFGKIPDFSKITIITADVTKRCFGLSNDVYSELSNSIDLVINCAANVKYYGDYDKFKEINVDVVDHLIDFCMQNDIKLAHVSTLGVSGNYLVNHEKNYNDFDENDFFIGQNFKENVYIQTKFEAEELIYNKISSGLNAAIFRVGNLTGRYSDGLFQKNINDNAFYNILRLILKYGILPDTMLDNFLEFTPIDYCAKAICKLLYNFDFSKFVFHIFNQNYITVKDILDMFLSLGFNTTILSGANFKQKILELSNQNLNENILKGIVNDLDDNLGLAFNSTVNQKNLYTNSYLTKVGFDWPNVDIQYIQKIIDYMKKNKYI